MTKVKVKILSNLLCDGESIKIGQVVELQEIDALSLIARNVAEYFSDKNVDNEDNYSFPDTASSHYREKNKDELLDICKEKGISLPSDTLKDEIILNLELFDYYNEKDVNYLKKLATERRILFWSNLKKKEIIFILIAYDEKFKFYQDQEDKDISKTIKEREIISGTSSSIEELTKLLALYDFIMEIPNQDLNKICHELKIDIKPADKKNDLILKVLQKVV